MKADEIYKKVGERVRTARLSRNLTQDDVCELVPLSRASLSNIEVGRHRIQLHVLFQLAEALEVPIVDLIVSNDVS